MAHQDSPDGEEAPPRRKRRPVRNFFLASLLILIAAFAFAWWQREQIARDLITETLAGYGIEAQYDIATIDPDRQVLRNIVIGDPDSPDLTIARAELVVRPRFGLPNITHLTLERPRLWGRIVDGKPSFGSLDPILFAESEEAFVFPNMVLSLIDGRALVEGDYGPVAIRLEGDGHLRGGFRSELAVVAPDLKLPGCAAHSATLFGELGIDAERPEFSGPLRFETLECGGAGVSLAEGALQLALRMDRNLADLAGDVSLQTGRLALDETSLAALTGEGRFTYRAGQFVSDFAVNGRDIATRYARLAEVEAEGGFRADDTFGRLELDAQINGRNLIAGNALDAALADAQRSGEGSLIAPLLQRFRQQLPRELRGSTLAANLDLRREEDRFSLVAPDVRVRGNSGASLLALSRVQVAMGTSELPLISANFATGGEGLPQLSGRMEQDADGTVELRMRMREYSAGDASLSVPELNVRQARNGALSFTGRMLASGGIPGGSARGLAIPLVGNVSASGVVTLWDVCTPFRFDALTLSNLQLQRESLTLCPASRASILRFDDQGVSFAGKASGLELNGSLGETPVAISTGAVGLSYPGMVSANSVEIALGEADAANRFLLGEIGASFDEEVQGTFSGVDVQLASVPLNILRSTGQWQYGNGVLQISQASFTLEDRQEDARFKPLESRDAVLTLEDNQIESRFSLQHPGSGTQVVRVAMVHDLDTAAGNARLMVDDLAFGRGFQPTDLTDSLLGVVSLVEGNVFGRGRIDWDADEVTSSGSFSTESLDLAAAFGPVKGARGTIEFSDLLGLTTPPGQRIFVQSINPGIEVFDGEVSISLTDGTFLQLEAAAWPFMGGTLTMRPLRLAIGVEERRSYILEIEGLEAQRFIEHMEMDNLAATGVFDGTIPVVFDELGNGSLEGGVLLSRPPGGSVSYIGELTYEDLTPIANYAFDALRDLEYDEMMIEMNGSLIGELVTRVSFDGVRQGEGASRNIVTKQLANLPIRFIVNVEAPFYSLMSDLRSLYDPAMLPDPRERGLLREDGQRLVPGDGRLGAPPNNEPDIQPPEREQVP